MHASTRHVGTATTSNLWHTLSRTVLYSLLDSSATSWLWLCSCVSPRISLPTRFLWLTWPFQMLASPWLCPSAWSTTLGAVIGTSQTGFAAGVYFPFTWTCTQAYCSLLALVYYGTLLCFTPCATRPWPRCGEPVYHALRSGYLWPSCQRRSSCQVL